MNSISESTTQQRRERILVIGFLTFILSGIGVRIFVTFLQDSSYEPNLAYLVTFGQVITGRLSPYGTLTSGLGRLGALVYYLYFILLKIWASPICLIIFSLVINLATILMIFNFFRKREDFFTGLAAATIIATTVTLILHAGNIRQHTILPFAATAWLIYFLTGLEKRNIPSFLLSFFFLAIVLHAHIMGFFLIPAGICIYFVFKPSIRPAWILIGIALVFYTYYFYFLEEYHTGWHELQSYLYGMTTVLAGTDEHVQHLGPFPNKIVFFLKNYFGYMHPIFGVFATVFLIWGSFVVIQNLGKKGDREQLKLWFPWLAVQFWGLFLLLFRSDGYRYLFIFIIGASGTGALVLRQISRSKSPISLILFLTFFAGCIIVLIQLSTFVIVAFLVWAFLIVVQNYGKTDGKGRFNLWFPCLVVLSLGLFLLIFRNDPETRFPLFLITSAYGIGAIALRQISRLQKLLYIFVFLAFFVGGAVVFVPLNDLIWQSNKYTFFSLYRDAFHVFKSESPTPQDYRTRFHTFVSGEYLMPGLDNLDGMMTYFFYKRRTAKMSGMKKHYIFFLKEDLNSKIDMQLKKYFPELKDSKRYVSYKSRIHFDSWVYCPGELMKWENENWAVNKMCKKYSKSLVAPYKYFWLYSRYPELGLLNGIVPKKPELQPNKKYSFFIYTDADKSIAEQRLIIIQSTDCVSKKLLLNGKFYNAQYTVLNGQLTGGYETCCDTSFVVPAESGWIGYEWQWNPHAAAQGFFYMDIIDIDLAK